MDKSASKAIQRESKKDFQGTKSETLGKVRKPYKPFRDQRVRSEGEEETGPLEVGPVVSLLVSFVLLLFLPSLSLSLSLCLSISLSFCFSLLFFLFSAFSKVILLVGMGLDMRDLGPAQIDKSLGLLDSLVFMLQPNGGPRSISNYPFGLFIVSH